MTRWPPRNATRSSEAPVLLKPLLYPIMWLFFAAPEKAAAPVTYACCSEDLGRRTGVYLHLMQEKQPSRLAMDEGAGARLWSESSALLARHVTGGEADGSGALSDQPAGDA